MLFKGKPKNKIIMKILKTCLAVFLMITMTATSQTEKDKKIINDAEAAKTELIKMNSDISPFFSTSSGYVIFPNVGKGGLIIGGASGNGVVYEDGMKIGMADLKKLSVGLQAGGQAVIEVIFFETDDALSDFKEGNYELSAEISAVVLDKGKSKNLDYSDGVLVVTMTKGGLMADISVVGQKFDFTAFK